MSESPKVPATTKIMLQVLADSAELPVVADAIADRVRTLGINTPKVTLALGKLREGCDDVYRALRAEFELETQEAIDAVDAWMRSAPLELAQAALLRMLEREVTP